MQTGGNEEEFNQIFILVWIIVTQLFSHRNDKYLVSILLEFTPSGIGVYS
jgi:hypothetical protein